MKKISTLFMAVFLILCSGCSGDSKTEEVSDFPTAAENDDMLSDDPDSSTMADDDTIMPERAEAADFTFTAIDPQYKALIDRTRMTLGIQKEDNWNLCAIQPDGALWIRNNEEDDYLLPEAAKLMDDVVAFSSRELKVLAVRSDGSLWSWDRDGYEGAISGNPVQIMDDVVAVTTENHYSLAIKSDGSLWSWGQNLYGQLGDGTTESRDEPVKVMDDVASVSAFNASVMAIKKDGSLWAWGENTYGQLGNGTTQNQCEPVKIMDDVVAVSAEGNLTSMALRTDGSLWAWGAYIYGCWVGGPDERHIVPKKVFDDVTCFSTATNVYGNSFTMAVRSDGSLWGWGSNIYGQLGDGSEQSSTKPVHIMDDIAYVSAFSNQYAIAVGTDDSIWTWGKGVDLYSNVVGRFLDTPLRINMDNLPHNENEPDWILTGMWQEDAWGIAGCPPTWSARNPSSMDRITGMFIHCDFNIVSEDEQTIIEVGNTSESENEESYELEEVIDSSIIDNLSFEKFIFNDGNTGLMITDRQDGLILWVNGAAVMACYYAVNPDYNEEMVMEIARTLCDHYRNDRGFLNAVDNKLAEIDGMS